MCMHSSMLFSGILFMIHYDRKSKSENVMMYKYTLVRSTFVNPYELLQNYEVSAILV